MNPEHGGESGLTLIETVVGLAILALTTGLVVTASLRMVDALNLQSTATSLVYRLRYLQQLAQTKDVYTQARMASYSPTYTTYEGTNRLNTYSFAPGVNYHDGYLQMPTGNFLYDSFGNAQMAGVLRLTAAGKEEDINLYMGCGWQTMGGIADESP